MSQELSLTWLASWRKDSKVSHAHRQVKFWHVTLRLSPQVPQNPRHIIGVRFPTPGPKGEESRPTLREPARALQEGVPPSDNWLKE